MPGDTLLRDGEDEEGVMSERVASASSRANAAAIGAGYSLIELLMSTAIMLTVTGAIFALMNPAQGTSRRRRPRSPTCSSACASDRDALFKELVMAGAGSYQGMTTGRS